MPLHEAKIDLHREFREREKLRIDATPKLSEKFRQVKTLKIELDYFEGDSTRRLSLVTYTLNLDHACAAFTFPCPNDSCLEGDFDLSLRLTEAVQNQQANIKGEMR